MQGAGFTGSIFSQSSLGLTVNEQAEANQRQSRVGHEEEGSVI